MTEDHRPLIDLVAEKLHSNRDPIGCGVPWDEYMSYAAPVIAMVRSEESVVAVARYLRWVRTGYMGMQASPEADLVGAQPVYAMIAEYQGS